VTVLTILSVFCSLLDARVTSLKWNRPLYAHLFCRHTSHLCCHYCHTVQPYYAILCKLYTTVSTVSVRDSLPSYLIHMHTCQTFLRVPSGVCFRSAVRSDELVPRNSTSTHGPRSFKDLSARTLYFFTDHPCHLDNSAAS